jgi:two-component system cell cycle response regulator DivK
LGSEHYEFLTRRTQDRCATRAAAPDWPFGAFREAAAMRQGASRSDPHGRRSARRKILIVEDNILNMKLFRDILVAHGYETLQSRDGAEAMALTRRHRPDLILMDIQLPEVSGLQVIKWLKEDEELQAIPVIAVTAFAMKGDEQKIREGGCEGYIAKPISIATFLQTIEHFLS